MATYLELATLSKDKDFLSRIERAITIYAQQIVDTADSGTAVADRAWVRAALYDPSREAIKAWNYLLAKFNAQDLSVIQGATDDTLQTQVDLIVPSLIKALART